MKFLNNQQENLFCYDNFFFYFIEDTYYDFEYEKINIKNRKNLRDIRKGVSKNVKKDSLKRDSQFNLIGKFITLNTKKGKKLTFSKNVNYMLENLTNSFNFYSSEFSVYTNYENFFFLNSINSTYSNINNILDNLTSGLESVFEIKTKKNNKKLKLKEKYAHEIVYIPKAKRLKYVLKSLSIYKESFKKYNLWERLFWSFFIVIINKEKSFLSKRREYIYIKSVKFFKKKKNPLK